MKNIKYIYWQDGADWLGYLEEFPDYATQGTSLDDLKEHLKDLYTDLAGGAIPGVRHEGELVVAGNAATGLSTLKNLAASSFDTEENMTGIKIHGQEWLSQCRGTGKSMNSSPKAS